MRKAAPSNNFIVQDPKINEYIYVSYSWRHDNSLLEAGDHLKVLCFKDNRIGLNASPRRSCGLNSMLS